MTRGRATGATNARVSRPTSGETTDATMAMSEASSSSAVEPPIVEKTMSVPIASAVPVTRTWLAHSRR